MAGGLAGKANWSGPVLWLALLCKMTKSLPQSVRKVFVIKKIGPLCRIFGEDFSFDEEFAAYFAGFPRQTLRPAETAS